MSRLTIVFPGLFSELLADPAACPDISPWPALSTLLTRATVRETGDPSIEHTLLAHFGAPGVPPGSIPAAVLTAASDAVPCGWPVQMRADPVYLRPEPNQILLFNNPGILPDAAEADELLAALNAGFDDIAFSRGSAPGRWYSDCESDAETSPPGAANGRSIGAFLPRGGDAGALQQITNTAQMLLHDHPVNVAREARGVPPINSIWLWGRGTLPETTSGPAVVRGDDVFCAALAARSGADWAASAECAEVLERCRVLTGDGMVIIGAPTGAVDGPAKPVSPDEFEQHWCRPLLRALERLALRRLTIVTDKYTYTFGPADRYKFWRAAAARRRQTW